MTSVRRRSVLKAASGAFAAALPAFTTMSNIAEAAAAAANLSFSTLKPSTRMPVLFLGHGSPMNAIEDNAWRRSWQALGRDFGSHPAAKYPTPQLILCISAHWLTRGWHLTAMEQPKTIHDFGGFPQALFDQQYPAPGAPAVTRELAQKLTTPPPAAQLGLDTAEWGLDHGTWSVLKPMFPDAKIPVVQLSMDYHRPASEHFALGQQLAKLRDYGVLIVGSGNIVHNLRAMRREVPAGQTAAQANQAYDWALEFDRVTAEHMQQGRLSALADFQKLGAVAQQAHPTYDHYLPLLYTAGAASDKDQLSFFNTGFQGASISMRSALWT